jgi:hypothetical protein
MAEKKRNSPAARNLLAASKNALRFLLREEGERDEIVASLNKAIEQVEGEDFVDDLSSVTLVMTKATQKTLMETVDRRDDGSHRFKGLVSYIEDATRFTKQRVYMKLPIDYGLMRLLKMILLTTTTQRQDAAFKRLAEQIEREGLSKNPLEVLAQVGL